MHIPRSAVLVLALFGACTEPTDSFPLDEASLFSLTDTDLPTEQSVTSPTWTDMELDDVFIAARPSGADCTVTLTGWDVQPLFQADGAGNMPKFLRRFCRITRVSTSDPVPSGITGTITADLAAVSGRSAPTSSSIISSTDEQVRPLTNIVTAPSALARLAVLDTTPTTAAGASIHGVVGNDRHGNSLVTIARRALCDGTGATPDCVGSISSHLTMQWTTDSKGDLVAAGSGGGNIATQGDLAQAIQNEVRDWEDGGRLGPLVLNLSLGWHPGAGGTGSPGSWNPPVQAVHAALRYAACQEVLVIAAAGNRDTPDGEAGGTGAIFPAAWEKLSTPTAADCKAALGKPARGGWSLNNNPRARATYTPLVYAVSAVDVNRDPLPIARPGSVPQRVAAGDHLASYNSVHGSLIPAITGSSVATVVVSSAATAVRTLNPSYNAHETMKVVDTAGPTVNAPTTGTTMIASTCNGSPCGDVHFVSMCETIKLACNGTPACLTNMGTSSCTTALPTALVPTLTSATPDLTTGSLTDTCEGNDIYYLLADFNDYNCPLSQAYRVSTVATLLPMPDYEECDYCYILPPAGGGHFQIELHTLSDMALLMDKTVTIHYMDGTIEHHPLGNTLGGTHAMVEVPIANVGAASDILGATFDYMRSDGLPLAQSETIYKTW